MNTHPTQTIPSFLAFARGLPNECFEVRVCQTCTVSFQLVPRRKRLAADVAILSGSRSTAHLYCHCTHVSFTAVCIRRRPLIFCIFVWACLSNFRGVFAACISSIGRPRAGGGARSNRRTSLVAQAPFFLQVHRGSSHSLVNNNFYLVISNSMSVALPIFAGFRAGLHGCPDSSPRTVPVLTMRERCPHGLGERHTCVNSTISTVLLDYGGRFEGNLMQEGRQTQPTRDGCKCGCSFC